MNTLLNTVPKKDIQANWQERSVVWLKGNKNGISIDYDHIFLMGVVNEGLVPSHWEKLYHNENVGSFYWRCLPSLSNVGVVLHKLQLGMPEMSAAGEMNNNLK